MCCDGSGDHIRPGRGGLPGSVALLAGPQGRPPTTLLALLEPFALATTVALVDELGRPLFTHAELAARAETLAASLRVAGYGRGSLIAVDLERGPWLLVALIAVARAGAAWLPLEPAMPPGRRDAILADAAPHALLAAAPPGGAGEPVITALGPPPAPPDAPAGPADLAYLLYTSGSTGRPKGVEIPHGALANLLQAMRDSPGFGPADRLLALSPVTFDIAALELLLPFVAGGSLVIAGRETVAEPRLLAAAIASSGATMVQATPSTWRLLLETGWEGAPHLRLLCGGEALSRGLADALLARAAEVWNLYGPTETTIWSTRHRVGPGEDPVPIGLPIENTLAAVLDEDGHPVPHEAPGELHLGGDGLALRYRNLPDLTARRFAARPALGAACFYATGDRVRRRADGALEWLGRIDGELKLRGHRAAPEEVEAALEHFPGVHAAAVRAWPVEPGELRLVAYLVANALPDAAALRAHLAQLLPDALIPTTAMLLATLPRTPSGKLDRAALPPPGPHAAPAPEPPRTTAERRLLPIWQDVLGVPSLGIHDDFFDLGGRSLLAARLLRRVEDATGRRLRFADLFHAPTVAGMAGLLAADGGRSPAGLLPLQPQGTQPPLYWLHAGPRLRTLARALGPDQPFLGLALESDMIAALGPAPSIEGMAARFVDVLRAHRPHGPYTLGGWCNDGLIAWETARQLEEAGERVDLLVLAHAANPEWERAQGALAIEWSKAAYYLAEARRRRGAARWRFALGHLRDALRRATAGEADLGLAPNAFAAARERAARRYRPAPLRAAVLLFQPTDRPQALDTRPGWAPLAPTDFAAFEVDGSHHSMLDAPGVYAMARHLLDRLARARTRQPARAAE